MTRYYDLIFDAPNVYVQGYGYDTVSGTVEPNDQRSEARRTAIDDSVFSRSSLVSTLSQIRTGFGDQYPGDNSLVLDSIAGTLVDGAPAQYDAQYRPKRIGGIKTNYGTQELEWHKDTDGNDIPADKEPNYRVRQIPVETIEFEHFYFQVARPARNTGSIDTINDGDYTLTTTVGGITGEVLQADPKTLVYGTPQDEQFVFGDTSLWVRRFVFHYRADGWIGTRRADKSVEEFDLYPQSTFPSVP